MTDNLLEFDLDTPIPDYLVGEIVAKLAYVDETIQKGSVSPDGKKVSLQTRIALEGSQRDAVVRKVRRVVDGILGNAFKPRTQVLEDHLDRKTSYSTDPMGTLLANGEISREANGIYAFGPLLTRLIAYFESLFTDLATSFDARPYRFPTLIPVGYLERVNYFHAFPHSLSFATHLREDLDIIQEFSTHAHCESEVLSTGMDAFARIQTLLSPAVCYHLYFLFADRDLPADHLAATAVGSCFRYESSNLVSLERLWNFTMREVIFMGSKEYVLDSRETVRKRMEAKLGELGFAYRVESANDPFFIGEFKQAAFQTAFQLKYEIRASLPFKDATLAVGSYNYHQDFFGRSLNIHLPDGGFVHTGCAAFGLERMAYAFLAQFGMDPRDWPMVI
jgi:seryl-tRNA synthetase